ncbi:hypothetical protein BC833DRAFT_572672 [Globomyces pollinis-pini]|nr:hypothetical protein BC833DRAFT_572672 [Globomyces pollinis-pini]
MNQTASSIKLLKIIKNLCQVSDNLPMFDMSGAIEIICNLLWKPNEVVDIRTQVFSCLFYSLRLNSRRQERALRMGILKHLALSCSSNHPAKQFAVPILCDIVCHLTTETFWQENMLDILIKLLQDFCWRSVVLEAILSWISKEPSRVEDALLTSTKPVFQTIFLNPTPRYETENQIMSQLVRILSQNPKIGYLLLSDGIVLYLSRIGMIPSQQLTIDMLKIFFNLVRPNFNSYWKEHVKDYNLAMLTISKMQINNSVLVKQMVNNILEQLNKLRSSY